MLGRMAVAERRETDDIAKHHGDVSSLGIMLTSRLGDQLGLIEFGYHAQHFATMAEQDPEPIQVLIRQLGKDTEINSVLGKTQRVLPKPKLFKPVRNLLHWLHRLFGWRLAELWTTAIETLFQYFPDGTSCLRPSGGS